MKHIIGRNLFTESMCAANTGSRYEKIGPHTYKYAAEHMDSVLSSYGVYFVLPEGIFERDTFYTLSLKIKGRCNPFCTGVSHALSTQKDFVIDSVDDYSTIVHTFKTYPDKDTSSVLVFYINDQSYGGTSTSRT